MKTENELLIEFIKWKFPYISENLIRNPEFCNQYRNCFGFKLFVFNYSINHLKSILWKKISSLMK